MQKMKNKYIKYTRKSMFTNNKSKNSKYANSLYGHMFLEDMCSDFTIHFSPLSHNRDFFIVRPEDRKLKNLLEYDNHSFLRYELSRLLTENMYALLLDGVCYVKIELEFIDTEQTELKSVKFISIDSIHCCKKKDKFSFIVNNYEGKSESITIHNHLVIKHDLKDLHIRRNFFRKILKGLSAKDIPNIEWMKKCGVSFTDYINRQTLKSLRTVGHTCWSLREGDNEYINEIYLLYRTVMFNLYRYKFFEYLLAQYNSALRKIGLLHNFTGEIICSIEIDDHKKELEQLLSGEINCKNMCDHLFKF